MKLKGTDKTFDDRGFVFACGSQNEREVTMAKSSRGISPRTAFAAEKCAVQNDPSAAIGAKRLAVFKMGVAMDAARRKDKI